jgi:predicted Rossmann fold nucleotide-binding protein DprA/Smf involved in DNA uptake
MNLSSDAALLLTNRIGPVDVDPLKAKEYWSLIARIDPGELLGLSTDQIVSAVGDSVMGERVARLLGAATGLALAREELESSGIRMFSTYDDEFPPRLADRLADAAPPVLYVAGPVEWLQGPLIGVVGSRAVDEAGAAVARRTATMAAKNGFGVVSGGAKGVDLISMDAAYEAEVPSVGVTAEGLARASRRKEIRAAVAEERLCIASPFAPSMDFTVGNAMGRNKLIYAMAAVTLVVASDLDSGGTWAGATEALRRGFGPVAVWTGNGAGEGNGPLVERGAVPISDLDTWDPAGVESPEPPPEMTQLGLGLEP